MPRTNEISRGHAIGGGVVAGIIGGIVLAIILSILYVTQHQSIWLAMKGAGAPYLHERATQPGFDAPAVLLGIVAHFVVSIVWGVLFALIVYGYGLPKSATVLAGAVWGIVVWLIMYYVVLPLVGLGQMARSTPVGNAIILHVIFGLAVGLGFLPFQTSLEEPT